MPPKTEAVASPTHAPLHSTLLEVILKVKANGSAILIELTVVQPLLSVIITLFIPAQRPVGFALVCPPGDQLYEYGGTPLPTATDAVPLHAPKQSTSVEPVIALTSISGSLIVNDCPTI